MIVSWNEQAAEQDKSQNAEAGAQKHSQRKQADNDDLSLPASILGGEVKVASQNSRTSEAVLEDA